MNFFQLIDSTDNTYINFNLLIYINLWIDFNRLPYPGMTRQQFRALSQLYILLVRNWALYQIHVGFMCHASVYASVAGQEKKIVSQLPSGPVNFSFHLPHLNISCQCGGQ